MRLLGALILLVAPLMLGCGREEATAVQGDPVDVVRRAAQATLAVPEATVEIAEAGETTTGVLQPRTGQADLVSRSPDRSDSRTGPIGTDPLAADDPISMLHLLAGVSEADNFGGVALRGVATRRFDVVIDLEVAAARVIPERRPALAKAAAASERKEVDADVWVDLQGRIRRVQLPADLTTTTPPTVARREVLALVTLDFLRFGDEPK